MPSSSNLPSSFASAAAGQNTGRDARGGRADGRGSAAGDWYAISSPSYEDTAASTALLFPMTRVPFCFKFGLHLVDDPLLLLLLLLPLFSHQSLGSVLQGP
jgi:hypothetical protein